MQIDPKEIAKQIVFSNLVYRNPEIESPSIIVQSIGFWASSALGITGGIVLIHALARRIFDNDYAKKKLKFQAGLGGLLLAASTAWIALEIFNFNQKMAAYLSEISRTDYRHYTGPLLLIMTVAKYVQLYVSEYLRQMHPVPSAHPQ